MSFDWNLSSDEEEDFDGWARKNLSGIGTNQNKVVKTNHNNDDSGDDNGSDNEGFRQQYNSTLSTQNLGGVKLGNDNIMFSNNQDNDDDDDDDDDVDWEDADDVEDKSPNDNNIMAATAQTADATNKEMDKSPTLRPVTLNLNEKSETDDQKSKKKLKRTRKRYRYEHLADDMKHVLFNLERAHLLSLLGHVVFFSKYCSDDIFLNTSHSLIPNEWSLCGSGVVNGEAPLEANLRAFVQWFFDLVNATIERRERTRQANFAAGAPQRRRNRGGNRISSRGRSRPRKNGRLKVDPDEVVAIDDEVDQASSISFRGIDYCSYLSRVNDDDPQLLDDLPQTNWSHYDKVQLLVSMARSLGWRARVVMALEPIKKDLDVNHPIFVASSVKNVFQALWANGYFNNKDNDKKMPAKKKRKTSNNNNNNSQKGSYEIDTVQGIQPIPPEPILVWAEILCRRPEPSKNGKKATKVANTKLRWVHIDPKEQLYNEPGKVESILCAARSDGGVKNKKVAVAYVLAAEHVTVDETLHARVTDVTPRYAASWVETLKVRGVLRGKKLLQDNGKVHDVDKWWSNSLKLVNGIRAEVAKTAATKVLKSKGNSLSDAIDIPSSDDDQQQKRQLQEKILKATDVLNAPNMDNMDHHEREEFSAAVKSEPIPTSKVAFKSHPIYVLPSLLSTAEVLAPDAKSRICGVFKGELVYRRSDVRTALPAKKWPYHGRKVKKTELKKPIKRAKMRKKPNGKNFKAMRSYGVGHGNDGSEEVRAKIIEDASKPLEDGMEDLYAKWQTEPWSPPPVGPTDPIPVNEYNNVELELLNPGLAHVEEPKISLVAKQLGIPYAPCLLGFEGHGGNRTPTIRGIVVHEHNVELLRSAHAEVSSHQMEQDEAAKEREIQLRWKKLLVGILTKDRLDREYGGDDD